MSKADFSHRASCPVGLMDSGVGGLSVVRVLRQRLPAENLVYAADTGRMPYGPRPAPEVCRFTSQILRFLEGYGVKAAVIACNVASAASLPGLAAEFPFPIVGMIGAGARAAARATRGGRVGIIATRGTVASGEYPRALAALGVTGVWQEACPELPLLVEEGKLAGEPVLAAVRSCLEPLLARGIDTLVLGCTHFAFLAGLISRVAGPGIALVDPAEEVVRELEDLLEAQGLRRESAEPGWLKLYTSGEPERLRQMARLLLGEAAEVSRGVWMPGPQALAPERGESP